MPDHNLNRLQQYISKASFAHTADKNAAMKLAATLGGTPSGRAEELITQLEAEIVKRDSRIVELEKESIQDTKAINDLLASIHELKTQQPSGLVVHAIQQAVESVQAPEGMTASRSEYFKAGARATVRAVNSALKDVARLNPCRAQSVPDGYVLAPVEPTPEMRAVIMSGISHDHVVRIYKDMLAAAATPSAQQKESGYE